jgi:type IV secretory pathway TraG/TraD family ATPase VirD4
VVGLDGQNFRRVSKESAVRIFMAAQDDETARYMSGECGDRELVSWSQSVREDRSRDYGNGLYDVDVTYGMNTARQELLLPHQAQSLPRDRMLVLVRGVGAIYAKRRPYFKDWMLRRRARPNPWVVRKGGGWLKSLLG